ncbi:anion exchange 2-like [Paramuricea clavata]|uniref:Anion exchange 2-like n=1 Tax=Paramuricea clavata TaxID=317549 RepID=A0A7D9DI67_PARCT|nr:anion exchange 2-like [Paramuricea clavata]
MEAFKDIYKVFKENPIRNSYIVENQTGTNNTTTNIGRPNTALLHTVISFSTFGIAVGLRLFQDTRYFSPPVRRMLNFFSIPLAVTVMLIVSNFLDVYLNTVQVKSGITLSSPETRPWLINPNLSGKGKLDWGMAVLAAFPAVFVVIVIFIETEITVLMCFKETVSRKGSGFHTNLLVVAISIFICSIFGLPWMCLAAVETSNHIDSLRVWTSYNIPGIKSQVEKVRQQRVTLFFIGLATGLFLYQPFHFGHIPIALLSGLTLYMGVVATFGVQFFKRLELLFMAPSQHPYIDYLDNVPLLKVHLFTVIQIIMITLLVVIKSVDSISFIFPIFIMLMIPMRVLLGKYAFTPLEIEQLDNEQDDEHH